MLVGELVGFSVLVGQTVSGCDVAGELVVGTLVGLIDTGCDVVGHCVLGELVG